MGTMPAACPSPGCVAWCLLNAQYRRPVDIGEGLHAWMMDDGEAG